MWVASIISRCRKRERRIKLLRVPLLAICGAIGTRFVADWAVYGLADPGTLASAACFAIQLRIAYLGLKKISRHRRSAVEGRDEHERA